MTYARSGEICEEEGVAERSCHGLTPTPHSPSPCAAQDVGGRR